MRDCSFWKGRRVQIRVLGEHRLGEGAERDHPAEAAEDLGCKSGDGAQVWISLSGGYPDAALFAHVPAALETGNAVSLTSPALPTFSQSPR
jgi:hypothetical protein